MRQCCFQAVSMHPGSHSRTDLRLKSGSSFQARDHEECWWEKNSSWVLLLHDDEYDHELHLCVKKLLHCLAALPSCVILSMVGILVWAGGRLFASKAFEPVWNNVDMQRILQALIDCGYTSSCSDEKSRTPLWVA
jgi:hypothetical protein